jgi:anti-anti-sigma factor
MAAECEPALVALADHPLNTSRRVILDLAGVTYLDSSGVYALVQLRGRLLSLMLRDPSSHAARVLQAVGLETWIAGPR